MSDTFTVLGRLALVPLQVLQEQFSPHIGASPMALLSVIGRNMIGRMQVAPPGANLEEPAKPVHFNWRFS